MARGLTTAEARWLAGNCLPQHAVSAAPDWPPGKYFRRVLKGNMRGSGQLETAYLMLDHGKHLCLKVKEPESLSTRFSTTVYHGTSLGALEKIMTEGFRPSLGAGSDATGRKYGLTSLPMVYTSGLLETAHGYVGNVDNGQRIGSGPMVNCVLWMKADPDGRLFKKRGRRNSRGELRNEQQGYHPKDLVVTRIYLHCVEAGLISPQKAKFGDNEPSGKDKRRLNADLRAAAALLFDEQQAPWWKPPPKVIQQKKKEGVAAGFSKTNRRVLQRWRKERRGEPASGSGAAPSSPRPRGVAPKSAPAGGMEHDIHLEETLELLAAMERDERVRLEIQRVAAPAPLPAPPASMEKDEGVQPSDSTGAPAEPSFPVALQRADRVPTGAAAREQLEQRRLAGQNVPPPRIPPPAAQGSQRSRSPRQRRGDTRGLCINGCGRPAATGWAACCRTCSASGGISAGVTREHGPRCNAAWQRANEQPTPAPEPTTWDAAKRHAMLLLPSEAASRDTGTVNEPPTPVLEPTSRDAPAASPASSAATSSASRDAPAARSPVLELTARATPATSLAAPEFHPAAVLSLAKVFCAHCHQRRGNQRCIRCNLHPLCKKCLPMHGCNQRPPGGNWCRTGSARAWVSSAAAAAAAAAAAVTGSRTALATEEGRVPAAAAAAAAAAGWRTCRSRCSSRRRLQYVRE